MEALLKASSGGVTRRIAAGSWDATEAARAALVEAQREAARMTAEAAAEGDGIRRRAREEGRAEGLADLVAQATLLAQQRQCLLASVEADLVELAFDVAHAVMARWAERDREAVVESARRALEAARSRARVSVRAHPDDLEALREVLEEGGAGQGLRAVALLRDPLVERGGVVVETEVGRIEATLTSQLAALRRVLGERRP